MNTLLHSATLWLTALCLFFFQNTAFAQPNTLTMKGYVQAEDGRLLENASIVASANKRSISAVSNKNGFFELKGLSAGQSYAITFSSVGFESQVMNIVANGNSQDLIIKLKESSSTLTNVIVTALGIRREEKAVPYATTTVKGEQLTNAISGNWTDALSGKVPGLNLVRSNSGPTGTNKIILRGENNLTGNNEALIVLDGVIINGGSGRGTSNAGEVPYGVGSENMPADYGTSLNDINPEDIETVQILNGPTAAALYGWRAANGAVMITTKSGSTKRKGWGVTVNSNASIEKVNRWPDLQFEYGQGLDGALYYSFGASPDGPSTSATSSAYGPRFNGQSFFQYDPVTQKQGTTRTPWVPYTNKIRNYFETAQTFTNTVTVDGGTDRTTARFSFTNVQNKWIMPNTGYKRNTLALSVNSKVTDRLQISSKINYTNKSSDNLPGSGYGNQSIMYWFIFWQPNADPDWLKEYWIRGQQGRRIFYPFSSFPENPYAIANEFINSSNRHNLTGNVQATLNITKELSLQIRSSLDFAYEQRAQMRPYDAGTRFPKGSYRTQNIFSQDANSDFLLRYAKKINKDLDFSVTLGGATFTVTYNRDEIRADSLNTPGLYTMANTLGPLATFPNKSKYRTNGLYGLATVAFKNYLFMDLTARQDWTSTLATPVRTENAGFFYPSAGLSFIVSEKFRLPRSINYAKVRFSVAGVGSGSDNPYQTSYDYALAPSGSFYAGGGLQNPTILPNPDMRPLRTISYEIGTTVKMFHSRLGLDIAAYRGLTKDQILSRVLDQSTGYPRAIVNAGEVSNRGIEISLNGSPLKNREGLNWNADVVFSANENHIDELADSSFVLQNGPVGGGQIVVKEGGSMGDLYGRGYVRSPDGQVVYDATTGFALISQDVKYLGNTIPKWKLGFGNEFTYKGFRLNFRFDAQFGAVAHSLMHYKLAEQGKLTKTLPGRYNGIIGNGVVMTADGKYAPNTTIATDIDEYYRSHYGVDNAEGSTFSTDFIKFREARFDYTISQNLTKKLGIQRATIGVYGRDLFIWSPWPMFDPEFGTLSGTASGGIDIIRGFEIAQFPSTRSFGANLIVSF